MFAYFLEPSTPSGEELSTIAPTKSKTEEVGEQAVELTTKLAKEMGLPTWGLVAILVGKYWSHSYITLMNVARICRQKFEPATCRCLIINDNTKIFTKQRKIKINQ